MTREPLDLEAIEAYTEDDRWFVPSDARDRLRILIAEVKQQNTRVKELEQMLFDSDEYERTYRRIHELEEGIANIHRFAEGRVAPGWLGSVGLPATSSLGKGPTMGDTAFGFFLGTLVGSVGGWILGWTLCEGLFG